MFFKIFFSALLIISLLGISYFLFDNSQKDSVNLSEELKIQSAIEAQKNENLEFDIRDVKIVQQNSQYARAIFLNSADNFGSFFLVKIANDWQVVEVSETNEFFCEKMEKIGFPASFITDCSLEFPKAENVLTFSEKLKSPKEKAEEYSVIGLITLSPNPAEPSFLLTSGEQTIKLNYNPDSLPAEVLSFVSNGDQVLVNVQVLTNEESPTNSLEEEITKDQIIEDQIISENSNEDFEENTDESPTEESYSLVVNNLQEINEDFFIPVDEYENEEEISEADALFPPVDSEETPSVYDITEYQQEYLPSRDYFFNFLDINNSHEPIHLIGN